MIKINLLDFRKEKIRLKLQAEIVGACLLVFASLGIIGVVSSIQGQEIQKLNLVKAQKNKELASLRPVQLKVAESEKMQKRLETIVKAIVNLKANQKEPARLFDEMLNRRIPFGELWLDRIVETKEGISLEGFSFRDSGISLFMKSLENMGTFKDVILQYVRQKKVKKRKVKKFKIICLRSGELYSRQAWMTARSAGGDFQGGGTSGGLYGMNAQNVFSRKAAFDYGQQLSREFKQRPRNPFIEARNRARERKKKKDKK